MSGAYAAAVSGDETCATPEPVTHQNPMRSTSADQPEAQRNPGAWADVDLDRDAPGRVANEDDGDEDGHIGVYVARVGRCGDRRPAWPSRKPP
jgi:hypothetical protein